MLAATCNYLSAASLPDKSIQLQVPRRDSADTMATSELHVVTYGCNRVEGSITREPFVVAAVVVVVAVELELEIIKLVLCHFRLSSYTLKEFAMKDDIEHISQTDTPKKSSNLNTQSCATTTQQMYQNNNNVAPDLSLAAPL